jgi:putative membrane-bound dehydrogenase-like protein
MTTHPTPRLPQLLALTAKLLFAAPLIFCSNTAAQSSAPAPAALEGPARGLTFHKWSGALNVPDPVACTVDPQGRVYVSATTRRKAADLDIREHAAWIPNDVALTSVAEKSAFLREALAPGKLRAPRGGLKDHNKDGSIDWKDLTVFSERIYQLRDTDGDGTADKITVFAEGFNTEVTGIAAGVLYHDGWVYATIAPDLWRLKDTDDDGVADVREVVAHGFGLHIAYGGHDMHGLSVGPDGRIYWSIGDKGVNTHSKEGRHYFVPNEGCIFRAEPDGSNFEVYAHGLRNPQEPAFDDFGDLIAVDNDADFKGEKERLVYIPEASDSGWRCNYQYMGARTLWTAEKLWMPAWDGQAAYHLPPICLSTDGPSGFKHDPGTALGPDQRGMFFLTEFPSGILRAFTLQRAGASFTQNQVFLCNKGITGIGMSWNPDGSLMVADWSGGYPLDGKGAVWRIDAPAGADAEVRSQTHALLKAGFEGRPSSELTTLLGHADQRVRLGAQFALARGNESGALMKVAGDSKASLLARVHGIWGYGQLLRKKAAPVRPALELLKSQEAEVRAQSAMILGESAASPAEAERLLALLGDKSPRVRLRASLAIARLKVPTATKALFALAQSGMSDPVLRHGIVTALASCATAKQLVDQHKQPSQAVRLAAVLGMRRQSAAGISIYLRDPDPAIRSEAARAIHDNDGIADALPMLAELAVAKTAEDAVAVRAINANLRLGKTQNAERLLALALNVKAKVLHREEALASILAWKDPSTLDRVDGFARRIETQPIDSLLNAKLDPLLSLTEPELRTTAVKIVIAHALKPRAEQVAAIISQQDALPTLRAEAMRLMAGLYKQTSPWKETLQAALSESSPPELQQEALAALLPEEPAMLAERADAVLKKGKLQQRQHLIGLLAKASHPSCDAVLERLGGMLAEGKCEASIRLDVFNGLEARRASIRTLNDLASAYAATPQGTAHGELLEGGDSSRGKDLVQNHLGANCLACHALSEGGSGVGPNLMSIGAQRDRAYLLESLLFPNAQLAPGFGLSTVGLNDGTQLSGTIESENAEGMVLKLADGSTKAIASKQIASKTPPISMMPPMLGILSPAEIRDVVAFLSGLKAAQKK